MPCLRLTLWLLLLLTTPKVAAKKVKSARTQSLSCPLGLAKGMDVKNHTYRIQDTKTYPIQDTETYPIQNTEAFTIQNTEAYTIQIDGNYQFQDSDEDQIQKECNYHYLFYPLKTYPRKCLDLQTEEYYPREEELRTRRIALWFPVPVIPAAHHTFASGGRYDRSEQGLQCV